VSARIIDTERLRMRPLTTADIDALHTLCLDPDVARFLFDGERIPRSVIEDFVVTSDRSFAAHGYGLWCAEAGEPRNLVGFGGFWMFHDPPVCELFYGLGPQHWGRGYATEMGRALMRFGFERIGMDVIRASTDVPNTKSVRVLERLRMRFDRETADGPRRTVHYLLPRAAWQAGAGTTGLSE